MRLRLAALRHPRPGGVGRRLRLFLATLRLSGRSMLRPSIAVLLTASPLAAQTPVAIGRLHYEGGGDWYANPSSLPNLIDAVRQRTAIPIAVRERVVELTSPDLWDVPFLHMTGHGNVSLSVDETRILRRYLENGGFLHADDNYGMDESFRREIAKVFPDRPLVEVPLNHPVYSIMYQFPRGIPKIHEHDGLPAQGFGIFIEERLAVFYSYQSDLGDGWEDPNVHDDPPEVREAALRMGVNLVVYAVLAVP